MAWSTAQIPSLAGRTAVVTGANSGIGYHTALELARHGAEVTLAVRTAAKGERAAEAIRSVLGGGEVHVASLDLGSLASVETFAASWEGPLDLLVNNAGVMTPPRYTETADGFEMQFGTNHLGHFALTGRLLGALMAADAPRVVTVSSIAHRGGDESVLAGNPKATYKAQKAYSNSKLANALFSAELARRAGASLTSVAAHPGVSATNLVASEQGLGALPGVTRLAPVLRVLLQSAAAGAEPTLYAATQSNPPPYSGPQRLRETRGPAGPAVLAPAAVDADLARSLWEVSEGHTGVRFDL